MKKILILFILLPLVSMGQQYKIDSTFGVNGFSQNFNSFIPQAIFVDSSNAYYFAGLIGLQSSSLLAIQKTTMNGSLDTTFDGDGQYNAVIHMNEWSTDLEVLHDHKTILVGSTIDSNGNAHGWLIRLNAGGFPDIGFNNGMPIIFDDFPIQRVDVLLNQKIQLYGTINNKCALKRLNETGTLDSAFAVNGTLIVNPLQNYYPGDMYCYPNGSILVAGSHGSFDNVGMPLTDFTYFVQKITPQGLLDSSFGVNSSIEIDYNPSTIEIVKRIHVSKDQTIVIAGWSNKKLFVVKLSEMGVQDLSFGTNGQLYDTSIVSALTVLDSNNLLIASASYISGNGLDVHAKRYQNGVMDQSFGNNNELIIDLPNTTNYLSDVKLDFEGRLIFAFNASASPMYLRCAPYQMPNNQADYLQAVLCSIYPNPFDDVLIVENDFEQDERISIYNVLGVLVYTGSINKIQNRISHLSHLPSGLYYIKLKNSHQIHSTLIKK